MKILAIDQGDVESGYIIMTDKEEIIEKGKINNEELLKIIKRNNITELAIEKIKSFGMSVGQTTFDSCVWAGRFIQCFLDNGGVRFQEIPRKTKEGVCKHICKNSNATDSNIRQALIDRYEPNLKPRQRPKNKLKGVSKDIWSALSICVTYIDKFIKKEEG
jgi:hypothetical protein